MVKKTNYLKTAMSLLLIVVFYSNSLKAQSAKNLFENYHRWGITGQYNIFSAADITPTNNANLDYEILKSKVFSFGFTYNFYQKEHWNFKTGVQLQWFGNTEKQLSVPSLTDLYQIYNAIGTGNIFSPSTFTFFLVTEHGTKYALQINDKQAFLNSWLANVFFRSWNSGLVRRKAEEFYGDEDSYNINPNKTNTQNELQFAKILMEQNLGMSLLKANDDFTQWTKIKYQNGILKGIPCN